ncbi:MAG: divalent-cation tolerance protein CutA [Saprospiraceae bacterium]|jgi:periplasmic divalent cation tolerance protein|nr:divalent-cation tolerance protein CutA [Saprospiraceae bacterium]MBK6477534.1 divalent-cation tolerance protein CutA [Saprospiraceae bacterium]MBK6816593.1 divalent-cation tolerance protein CutA [Saprospiraceae bacterium]MBK7371119.1 divalent-cation tolerance protein CutA [Saprospiraceae bacterium]MBK7436381.1 divalent-cation tolerance protein CutA [Saprospiraceae bacterium]
MVIIAEIHTTYAGKDVADHIALDLVQSKLIACANLIEARSYFYWEDKSQCENEILVIMKTMPDLVPEVIKAITRHHPYQLPAITWSAVNCTDDYGHWVENQTTLSAQ